MDADKMSHVCRTCLEEINESNPLELNDAENNIKIQLLSCIPELDIELIPNACMCIFCARALQNAYDFKLKCLQSEVTIREHVQDSSVPNLNAIKNSFEPDSDVLNIADLEMEMEIIYIRDEHEPIQSFLNDNNKVLDQNINSYAKSPALETPTKPTSRLKSEELKLQSQTSRSFLLKQHMTTHSKPTEPIKVKPQTVKTSVITHNGVKGFLCNLCTYTAKTKSLLVKHKLSHKQRKNYTQDNLWSQINGKERSSHISDEKNLKITIKVLKKMNRIRMKPFNVLSAIIRQLI